jgi:hypothetical protein
MWPGAAAWPPRRGRRTACWPPQASPGPSRGRGSPRRGAGRTQLRWTPRAARGGRPRRHARGFDRALTRQRRPRRRQGPPEWRTDWAAAAAGSGGRGRGGGARRAARAFGAPLAARAPLASGGRRARTSSAPRAGRPQCAQPPDPPLAPFPAPSSPSPPPYRPLSGREAPTMLALSAKIAPGALQPRLGGGAACRKAVVARAKEMREFREDTGEVTVAGEEKAKDKALYADQMQQAVGEGRAGAAAGPAGAAAVDCAPARAARAAPPLHCAAPRRAAPRRRVRACAAPRRCAAPQCAPLRAGHGRQWLPSARSCRCRARPRPAGERPPPTPPSPPPPPPPSDEEEGQHVQGDEGAAAQGVRGLRRRREQGALGEQAGDRGAAGARKGRGARAQQAVQRSGGRPCWRAKGRAEEAGRRAWGIGPGEVRQRQAVGDGQRRARALRPGPAPPPLPHPRLHQGAPHAPHHTTPPTSPPSSHPPTPHAPTGHVQQLLPVDRGHRRRARGHEQDDRRDLIWRQGV